VVPLTAVQLNDPAESKDNPSPMTASTAAVASVPSETTSKEGSPTPVTTSQLHRYMQRMWRYALDPLRPLWRFEVCENFEGGKTAIFFRAHHALGDGVAFMSLILNLMDEHKENAARKPASIGLSISTVDRILHVLQFPFLLAQRILGPANRNIFHGTRQLTGDRYFAWKQVATIEQVKSIKNVQQVSFNDVLMSCMAGALRRYVSQKGSIASDMTMNVPISFRNRAQIGELNNEFSIISISLPVAESDPLQCLRTTSARMNAVKRSPEALGVYLTFKLFGFCPGNLVRPLLNYLANKNTAVLTNVPGPASALYANGQKIHELMFWVPAIARIGLGISILSYDGTVRLGVTSDSSAMTDPATLIDMFKEEFDRLNSMSAAPSAGKNDT